MEVMVTKILKEHTQQTVKIQLLFLTFHKLRVMDIENIAAT